MPVDREIPLQQTVLIVDDEPIILRFASSVLGHAGYRTVVAENGIVALELYLKEQSAITLVLTDLVMPGGSGLDLVSNIASVNPETTILVMSGYSNQVMEAQARGRFPFIRKPFLRDDLLRKVRELLGQ